MPAEMTTLMSPEDVVIGLVGAVGTDLPWVESALADHLSALRYDVQLISLSALMDREYEGTMLPREKMAYDAYVDQRMTAGNMLRHHWGEGQALARLAIEQIRRRRDASRAIRSAYVLRSLKRPEEVRLLRDVYRGQFVLIGCHTPREVRIRQLADQIAKTRGSSALEPHRSHAERLADRDEHERGRTTTPVAQRKWFKDYGQSVEETFPLADAYITLQPRAEARRAVRRFCDLLLGSPFISPSRDEVAMFHARSASLRSADLSRQVGAAIATPEGDIIAVGCNEVPRAGGGSYWEGDKDDARDFQLGVDGNQDQRDRALREAFDVLVARGLLAEAAREAGPDAFAKALDDTRMDGLIEFTRATHAEMAALLDAARRGASVSGAVLYTSTFPCHNCAKHIVTAGIARVVFIEPYPKSLAEQLHGDAIAVDEVNPDPKTVRFEHFTGVAPVNYFPLFSNAGKRKTDDGRPHPFNATTIAPKLRTNFNFAVATYEESVIDDLRELRRTRGRPSVKILDSAPRVDGAAATAERSNTRRSWRSIRLFSRS
ncbi:MAG TPA: anti-phage dCTP deaminase [Capillimicrobium sp.]|nr:anti-phage dCTP deaminase [Capillimicrobium sp.]